MFSGGIALFLLDSHVSDIAIYSNPDYAISDEISIICIRMHKNTK
jgi:hypothetical protein